MSICYISVRDNRSANTSLVQYTVREIPACTPDSQRGKERRAVLYMDPPFFFPFCLVILIQGTNVREEGGGGVDIVDMPIVEQHKQFTATQELLLIYSVHKTSALAIFTKATRGLLF